jgi:seryl-tRNA synthetase
MLDINLFRQEKGGDPEVVRNSQRSRGKPVELVDEVIVLDVEWRQSKTSSSSSRIPKPFRVRSP